jgi:hypothetical protein
MDYRQILLSLGEGETLSIVQGSDTHSGAGNCEVAVLRPGRRGLSVSEPVGHLDAKALADYILTYLQDRTVGWSYD